MKKEDLIDDPFYIMAGRIPEIKVNDKNDSTLIIAVGNEENIDIAHFHVFRSEKDLRSWSNGAGLMFESNSYFDHGKNKETLSKDELNAINNKLKEKPTYILGSTYWQALVNMWNFGNWDCAIDIDTPIINYNFKSIERHKKNY